MECSFGFDPLPCPVDYDTKSPLMSMSLVEGLMVGDPREDAVEGSLSLSRQNGPIADGGIP